MPEEEIAQHFVDGKRRAACQPVPFSYDAPEELQCTHGVEGSKIASMCKAKYFSYHPFVVSLDDFKETEPCHENAVHALHPEYLITYTTQVNRSNPTILIEVLESTSYSRK
jgi:hypothetical protein